MSFITVEELQELAQAKGGKCVSIYLPTVKASDQVKQNRIRYKNLLNQAEKMLAETGMEPEQLSKYLRPAYTLENDSAFWQQQDLGLAVFINKDEVRTLKLPVTVEEDAMVNDHFYLKPLLSLLYEGGEFYILALSQNEVRLLKGTQHDISEVDIEKADIPKSIEDALKFDENQESIQWHTGTTDPRGSVQYGGMSGGERPAMYHGHGGQEDDKKARILQYFHMVDKGLTELLKDRQSPLVLAGVEYLHPIYKEANTYKHLVEKGIKGNPEVAKKQELHSEAWKMVEPQFKTAKEEIVQRFLQLDGWKDERATHELTKVVEAAPYGRVEVLFVDKNAKQFGTFDADNHKINLEDRPTAENMDLLDYAALQTLANGGIVYAVEPEDVPGGGQVSAILRY